jgi:endonuclease/exonuclease/phosphatase family metal-dependent hydrolase
MATDGLRVISYNIHKGFTSRNRKFVLAQIREAIRETQADVVFLQEVLGQHSVHRFRVLDWPEESQFEFLAEEIWPHYAYGKNAVYTSGHHGNAILSKYPFSFWENLDVSTNRMERRGILHGVIDVPHRGPTHVLCVHLGLLEADRMRQIVSLCERVEARVPAGEPLIISGDFNDWRKRATDRLLKRVQVGEAFLSLTGKHARTFPSWMPALQLDRVYYRGFRPNRAECLAGRPWNELSDHIALLVDFKWN